jgi:hypothetical protein
MGAGVDVSVSGSNVIFKGADVIDGQPSPAKVGAWWWKGILKDANNARSGFIEKTTEFRDGSITTASVVTPNNGPTIYYSYGYDHCCRFQALVSPKHSKSGSPYGLVYFRVDDANQGSAELNYSPLSPGPVGTPPIQTTTAFNVGSYFLSATYNQPTVPDGVTGLPGVHENPYFESIYVHRFKVSKSPTITLLYEPNISHSQLTFTAQVKNDVLITGGGQQVDPNTLLELQMDGHVVQRSGVLNDDTSQFIVAEPHGLHTFVAEYLGDKNELASKSSPITLNLG